MLVQEKVPGGKLLCVDAGFSEGKIARIRITGDFFLHPEETIDKIENALVGAGADGVAAIVSEVLEQNNAQLIGATPEDIERLVRRAVA